MTEELVSVNLFQGKTRDWLKIFKERRNKNKEEREKELERVKSRLKLVKNFFLFIHLNIFFFFSKNSWIINLPTILQKIHGENRGEGSKLNFFYLFNLNF